MTTMMTKKKILISFVLLLSSLQTLVAQEQPLKDFAEDRKERKLCFYPSTLRMLNLSGNAEFDELTTGIEKLLVYTLDSAARADKSYQQIIETYRKLDYEEYASVYGGKLDFFVYGKDEGSESEYVGIIKNDEMLTAFYLRGRLAVNKIPGLIRTMDEGGLMNPFDFNLDDFGKHTQD